MANKDFSKKRDVITFTIDDDVFEAYSGIATDPLLSRASMLNNLDKLPIEEQFMGFKAILELTLRPASYQLFTKRMSDPERPIEADQCVDVVTWLMGEYGLRPTNPSSPSSDGPPNLGSGTSSTESSPGVVLISVDSPSTSS